MARRLLGEDALAIESHWRFLYERAANFGVRGTELRALSALDVVLWDLLGQVCNQPIYRLLGGPVRDKILVYNSCGNPQYGLSTTGRRGWPGFGALGEPGPLGDSWKLFHEPSRWPRSSRFVQARTPRLSDFEALRENMLRGLQSVPLEAAAMRILC